MRFCETNPIVMLANCIVTRSEAVYYDYGRENLNRVRLAKPNRFWRRSRRCERGLLSNNVRGRSPERVRGKSPAHNQSGFAPYNPGTAQVEEKGKMT